MNDDQIIDKLLDHTNLGALRQLAPIAAALGLAEDATAAQCVEQAAKMRAALEPFARVAYARESNWNAFKMPNTFVPLLDENENDAPCVGDFRRAAEVYAATSATCPKCGNQRPAPNECPTCAAQQPPVPASGESPQPRRRMQANPGCYGRTSRHATEHVYGTGCDKEPRCVPVDGKERE